MNSHPIRFYNRLIFKILFPVVVIGAVFSVFAVSVLTAPITGFVEKSFESNLRHISRDGISICDNYFNYLMELRMEDDPDMNLSLRNEAVAEIAALGSELEHIHMMVIKSGDVVASSLDEAAAVTWAGKGGKIQLGRVSGCRINNKPSVAYVRYFPFWDYHIVSFIFQKDYERPVTAGKKIVYLGAVGVLVSVMAAFVMVYTWFISKPLKSLVRHTEQVGKGEFETILVERNDEIGRLMSVYNRMVESLEKERSESTRLVDQLKQSESSFRNLFENVPMGICVMDEKGVIIACNESMHKTTGYSKESIRHAVFEKLFSDSEEFKELLTRIRQEELVRHYETRFVRPDDSVFTVELTLSAGKLNDQLRIIAIVENISQKRKLEAQLQHARKMEAVGTLAGGIAHDFNNILQAVKGYVAILLMDKTGDHADRKSLEAVESAADRAARLVRKLLMFSRKLEIQREPLDINRFIEQAGGLLEKTIPKMISIKFNPVKEPWTIKADAIQLEQIILNLGSNAADAMPYGGTITLETDNVMITRSNMPENLWMESGAYVKLTMTDTGHGIDREFLEHIFEPFFTTKELGRGTGLGLASVYGVVKEHDGYITCKSSVGQGTSFMIFLPAEPTRSDEPGMEPCAEETRAGEETILVVDDEPAVLEVASQGLGKYGYSVLTAASGEDALEIMAKKEPMADLVLLDISMPGMGGYRCLEKIRERHGHVKVVISSGYSFDLKAGSPPGSESPDDFIQKPYNIEELAAKIRQVLSTA